MLTSVIEMLLETLKELRDGQLQKFKKVLCDFHRYFSVPLWMLWESTDRQDIVFSVVLIYGQQSVETTREALMEMERTDLVQKLSDSSSAPKKKHSVDEYLSVLIHKVATMSAVKELLLETLSGLSSEELKTFRWLLQFMFFQRGVPNISWRRLQWTNGADELVVVMLENYSQQAVEMTREVLMEMNRRDLVQRLSETISGTKAAGSSALALGVSTTEKEKHSVDEHLPALIPKVETMASVIELLLETLKELRDGELQKFKKVLCDFHRYFSVPLWMLWESTDRQDIVFSVVLIYNQQSVEKTREALMEMKRTDLVQKLSDSSSAPKKKQSDEHRPALIQRVATIAAVKQLLLETLNDLNNEELWEFKQSLKWISFQKNLPNISWMLSDPEYRAEIVDLMLETYGQHSVEVIRDVFMKMNRTDLVQRLSKPSSGLKEKHYVDGHRPELSERAAAMAAGKQVLLETLKDLSIEELQKFMFLLRFTLFQKSLPLISWSLLDRKDSADTLVALMLKTCGQQSVEVTREVFMDMNRRDLVQRLSVISSGLKETHQSKPLHKKVTMTSVEVKLLEMLEDLSYGELEQFKHVLQYTRKKKGLPRISGQRMETADRDEMVELMVEIYGQQSVEVTREVLLEIHRRDLVQRLSDISLGSKGPSTRGELEGCGSTMQQVSSDWTKLEPEVTLTDADEAPTYRPWWFSAMQKQRAKRYTPELMVEIYGQQSVEVTREVLLEIHRRDLVQRLSDISLGSKGPSTRGELEGCGSTMQQVSSDWTKLEPEVTLTDADEAPNYSLQSEAGNFECSVSALRWVCKEKVSFKYQFCSLERHMERMESLQYMPAGPLMDITVIAGKLDEVYLPHWICVDGNPEILDKFAVLHIDDCGDSVEKVSEVTSSHVKLSEPVFSLKMVLVKVGFSVGIHCKVLIYKTNIPFLTLHVYLIPPDPAVQQELDKTEVSCGYQRILKQHPKKPLKMNDRFILTADLDSGELYRDDLMLIYESSDPNFFELFMKNPDTDIVLKLTQENDLQPVWTCVIQKDEYQSSTGPVQGQHFVDKHRTKLIERVSNIAAILDELLYKDVIQQETYDKIRVLPTCQEKMRELYSGPLKAGGIRCKDKFYNILEIKEQYLVDELKEIK
ncbi:uncharacterized protein LOC120562581 isoform X2 [Perca fluviatilis]|nr:uncharacterized protein LOC120562581 isoform X2 [Perca fluviatilis]XP_039662299.1 uncharacterized protein LOC120562581 isoform X2 [Perca fluviatilis]XP_039662300.1 uncharacterized protein LOC120562581 isoform X2 [Perca fluviatilis]XP_039662301.1 uncharacterized protein LOC120562581 isoform X2 [Perca fluviatilis]